jgi:phage FluMu protein Com
MKTEQVVMDDHRPAIRRQNELGLTYYTIAGALWEILQHLPRAQQKVENRVIRCDACGSDMKVVREYDGGGQGPGYWCFKCPKCKSTEIWSKAIIGGTLQAGEKEVV